MNWSGTTACAIHIAEAHRSSYFSWHSCGRGGLTNHHRGNKRFRDIVALHRPDYVRAPKIQKPSVARVIVRAIRNGEPPGRFLRKDEKTGKWIDIGDRKAAEKTSQALREKSNEERDKVVGDPGALGMAVLLPNRASYFDAATAAAIFAGTLPPSVVPAAAEVGATAMAEEEKTGDDKGEATSDDKAEEKEKGDEEGNTSDAGKEKNDQT
jgi:hypothetical protein